MTKPQLLKEAVVFVSANPELNALALKELAQAGFEINIIRDAANALYLEEVKAKSWKPALFLVDVVLPQMSGFEMTRRILSRYPDGKTPVILVAQHRFPEDILEASQSGAIALLARPVVWKDVKNELEKFRQKRAKDSLAMLQKIDAS